MRTHHVCQGPRTRNKNNYVCVTPEENLMEDKYTVHRLYKGRNKIQCMKLYSLKCICSAQCKGPTGSPSSQIPKELCNSNKCPKKSYLY